MRLRIVGIGLLNREVVQDEIARFPTYIVATPALTRSVLGDVEISYYGVQLQGGARYVPEVEREFTAKRALLHRLPGCLPDASRGRAVDQA